MKGIILSAVLLSAPAAMGQYLETTIPVGGSFHRLLWNPTSNKVYCSNWGTDNVTVISGQTNQVVATIDVGEGPSGIEWNSHSNRVYVISGEGNRLAVIDGVGDSLIRTVRLPGYPSQMAYNAAMNKLYVSCLDGDRVAVLDAGPDTVIKSIDVRRTGDLLWHPATNMLFCYTDSDYDTVKVIDCASDEIVRWIPVRASLWGWSLNPANGLVYLSGRTVVYAFTPTGDSLVAQVAIRAHCLCPVPFPNKMYCAVSSPRPVYVMDCDRHVVVDSILTGWGGNHMVCDRERGKVYCSVVIGYVYVIDANADTVVKCMELGYSPNDVCRNPVNSRVYIADDGLNVVYVIRDTTPPGIEEMPNDELRITNGRQLAATIIRNVLVLPHSPFDTRHSPSSLLDISGRKVMDLTPGENDVRHLAPGVYFVHQERPGCGYRVVVLP